MSLTLEKRAREKGTNFEVHEKKLGILFIGSPLKRHDDERKRIEYKYILLLLSGENLTLVREAVNIHLNFCVSGFRIST